jgi:DNA-binding transcriptional MerR regulator
MAAPGQGIRIAELARRSGTSKETIHFYLREGLLKKPKKTSRNMAYYDESHVEQLKLIKRLRTESYLPLNVIKKVLKEGKLGTSARQLDLAGELFGQGARAEFDPLTKKALSERSGLSEKRIDEYEAAGLLHAKSAGAQKAKRYGYEDVRVAEILKTAEEEAGEGGERVVLERFTILEKHMAELVKEELAHFFSRVIAEGDPRRALELLRGGRETIGRFLGLSRARRLRDEVEAMMPAIEGAITGTKPEALFYSLDDEKRRALGEPERKAALREKFDRRPEDPATVVALFEHLVCMGDTNEVLELYNTVRGRARDSAPVLALYAESMIGNDRLDEAMNILDRLREARPQPEPMYEALWGSIVLSRLVRNFTSLSSSTELIGYITRAFSAFDAARSTPPASLFESARTHLLLGRICIATPAFLGAREQGARDLEKALDAVAQLRREQTLNWGALERIELNAQIFLERIRR